MKKIIIPIVTVLALSSTALLAFGPRDHKGPNPKFRQILKQLDLSAEQIDQLKAQRKAMRNAPKPERPNRMELIVKYMSKDKFDAEGLKAEIRSVAEKHIEFKVQNAVEFYNILTPQQREKFINIAKKEALYEGL